MSDFTMQAIRVHDYGGPEQLVLERVPRPEPQGNEVLIHVFAAGVNPTDWKLRSGLYKKHSQLPLPWTPGVEGAGVVEAVGAEVTTLQPGQAVYGIITGAYAEYAIVPANNLLPKPAHLTFDQAAAVPHGALTAGQAIEDAKVELGQLVLVQGAAGGVGHFAVQLARWKGARLIGTASANNLEFVRSLGAETVIDYQAVPFETVVRDIDVVIDTVGGEVLDRSYQVLRSGGVLVSVAAPVSAEKAKTYGVRAMNSGRASPEKLQAISDLIESKQIMPVVGSVFPLAEARRAHELSETRHGRGRIILHLAD